MESTASLCPPSVRRHTPSLARQSLIFPLLPAAIICPSGEKATENTFSAGAEMVFKEAPSLIRQRVRGPKSLPQASVCPSGAKAKEATGTATSRVFRQAPSLTRQSLMM